MKRNKESNLSGLYCLHQVAYFFAIAGIGAFAVTYLLDKGFAAAQIGIMLASTNVCSCILQPLIGSYVDRRSMALLPRIILLCLLIAFASMTAIEWLNPALPVIGGLVVLGSLTFSMTVPLSNSLCAYYSQNRCKIDYGMGAGVGSLSFSVASLVFGYLIAQKGPSAMMLLALAFMAMMIVLILRYPKVQEEQAAGQGERGEESLSILGFCRRYRMFMLTMVGIMCLSACHAMAENYLIQLFERLGGGSEHVGIALFLACTTAAPFLLFFERIQKRTGVVILLKMAGVFFVAKALLLIWAPSILSIYLIELLQTVTYGFLYPPMYYLVVSRIHSRDMAKGQALASTLYTLGTALGNSLGGTVIDWMGLDAMLALAAIIAATGTVLIHLTITRQEKVAA